MSEYTPTREEVRERFIDGFPMDTWAVARDECGREFDRWLTKHDAEKQAEALEQAATEFHNRLPDGTGNGRAYNSHTVARMLRARAAVLRDTEGKAQ
jgi:hypothetical protein